MGNDMPFYIQHLEILGLVDNMTTMSLATGVTDKMVFFNDYSLWS